MFVAISLLTQTLSLALLSLPCIINTSALDYNTVVYKLCETDVHLQKTRGSNSIDQSRSETLSSFFRELESKSFESNFFKTLTGTEDSAVSGTFQCMRDYGGDACHRCVSEIHELSTTLCGNATSVRVQLRGCYLKYQIEAVDTNYGVGYINNNHKHKLLEETEHGLIHKTCDGATEEALAGFEAAREEALAAAADGVVEGHGFYAGNHELLHVAAQCDGDLEACDCGECVAAAASAVAEECRWSLSGQVYFDGCYVGYTYYPHGLPGDSYHEGKMGSTGKSLAIVVGVAAALVLALLGAMFLKRLGKKGDDL